MAKKEKKKAKKEEAETDAVGADGAESGGEGDGEGAPKKKKLAGKNLVLFIILPAILVLGAGGGAAFFLMKGGGPPAAHAEAGDHGKSKGGHGGGHGEPGESVEGAHGVMITPGDGVVYVELPEILVNITGGDGRPAYLKLKLTLEAADDDVVAALQPEIPRVTDQFNAFLRELRTDDLAGSSGAYRLRLELLRRVNLVIAPKHINAVLIEEMLVQ
ncbi:MAG: flagellar basal body protein FliL [Alphaproteobacteria bacterium]|nr:flagellar basal body protein FliL [Alphaproteobacteria bacterium]